MNNEEEALEIAQNSKLYRIRDKEKNKSYPELSAEQKRDNISKIVSQHRTAFQRNTRRHRVDLHNANAVEAEITSYMQNCEDCGMVPTFLGLSSFMGFSRIALYQYLYKHPDSESTKLLDNFRSASAAIIATASLNRTTDNATSIFLLKNSGLGLTDKQELELTRGIDYEPRESGDEIARRWARVFEEDGIELPD